MKRSLIVCVVLSMFVMAAGLAGAKPKGKKDAPADDGQKAQKGDKAAPRAFVKECAPDIKQLCKDVKRGDGAVAKCLAEHKDALKPQCMSALKQAKRVAVFRKACGTDAAKLCKGGKTLVCLKQHLAELSDSCKGRLTAKASKGAKPAPAADAEVADQAAVEEVQQADPVDDLVGITDEELDPPTAP